jgi:pyruvate formate lyase activating enzyme
LDPPHHEALILPAAIAETARHHGCASVAMTYNDPVVFFEFAADVADACHRLDIRTVAVTAGYLTKAARPAFFRLFDAANVDLKAFSPRFYRELCKAELSTVLETLVYIKEHTSLWLELTTLLIPGENDSDQELHALTKWITEELGPDTPVHFTAFHPDYCLLDRPATPLRTLRRAREVAKANGLRHVYIGNCSDEEGETTFCTHCHQPLIKRDRYAITHFELMPDGTCPKCHTRLIGHFQSKPGGFGNQRIPVTMTPI